MSCERMRKNNEEWGWHDAQFKSFMQRRAINVHLLVPAHNDCHSNGWIEKRLPTNWLLVFERVLLKFAREQVWLMILQALHIFCAVTPGLTLKNHLFSLVVSFVVLSFSFSLSRYSDYFNLTLYVNCSVYTEFSIICGCHLICLISCVTFHQERCVFRMNSSREWLGNDAKGFPIDFLSTCSCTRFKRRVYQLDDS